MTEDHTDPMKEFDIEYSPRTSTDNNFGKIAPKNYEHGQSGSNPEETPLQAQFKQAEQKTADLHSDFRTGTINKQELLEGLQKNMIFVDGLWWAQGVESKTWQKHENGKWVPAQPPTEPVQQSADQEPQTTNAGDNEDAFAGTDWAVDKIPNGESTPPVDVSEGAKNNWYRKLAADFQNRPQTRQYWEDRRNRLTKEGVMTDEEIDDLVNNRSVEGGRPRTETEVKPEDMEEVNISKKAEKPQNLNNNSNWESTLEEELIKIETLPFTELRTRLIRLNRSVLPAAYGANAQVLRQTIDSRIKEMQYRAEFDLGLMEGVRQRTEELQKKYDTLAAEAAAGKINSKDAALRLGQFRGAVDATRLDNEGKEEPDDLKGIRQYTLDEEKNKTKALIDNLSQEIKAYEEAHGIIPDFAEYLQGIERINTSTPEGFAEQQTKIRNVLSSIEKTRDSIKGHPAYKSLSGLVELEYGKLNKGELHPSIEAEVRTSLRICETYFELRENYSFSSDSIKNDMEQRIVPRLKSAGLLATTVDFETMFVEQYKDLPTQGAFMILQDVGLQGMDVTVDGRTEHVRFKAKMDPKLQSAFNETITQQIMSDFGIDRKAAERTLNIVKKGLLCKFEDMAWDEDASHPISEAIHFGNYLRSKNPAFEEEMGTEIDILTLGSSFDRTLRKINKPNEAVFQGTLDDILRNDPDSTKSYAALCVMWKAQNGHVSKLDFNNVSYLDGVASDAYEKYLTGTLPAMIDSKKAFFDASLGLVDRNTLMNSAKLLGTIRKVDPYENWNLKSRYLSWAIVRGSKDVRKDYDFSLTAGGLRRYFEDGVITENQMSDVVRVAKLRRLGSTTKVLQQLEGYQKRLLS